MIAKYGDQCDSNDSICPYCGDRYQVETEDYSEDMQEKTCDNCGKRYWLNQEFSVDHHTRADCELNDGKHIFERVTLQNGKEADFCVICDKYQSVV